MGRFGNLLLVGGETDLSLTTRLGEVVRFYLTNTANTGAFKVALPELRSSSSAATAATSSTSSSSKTRCWRRQSASSSTCSSTSQAS